jgi:hypothetical protein
MIGPTEERLELHPQLVSAVADISPTGGLVVAAGHTFISNPFRIWI